MSLSTLARLPHSQKDTGEDEDDEHGLTSKKTNTDVVDTEDYEDEQDSDANDNDSEEGDSVEDSFEGQTACLLGFHPIGLSW